MAKIMMTTQARANNTQGNVDVILTGFVLSVNKKTWNAPLYY